MVVRIYQETRGFYKGLWFADLYEGDELKVKGYFSGFESKKELLKSLSDNGKIRIYQKSEAFL